MLVVDFDAPDRLARASPVSTPSDWRGPAPLRVRRTARRRPYRAHHRSGRRRCRAIRASSRSRAGARSRRRINISSNPNKSRPSCVSRSAQSVTPAGAHWRAGGLMVQFLPDSPRAAPARRSRSRRRAARRCAPACVAGGRRLDRGQGAGRDASRITNWSIRRLSSERLLYRLFHERGVTVFEPEPLRDACRCSTRAHRRHAAQLLAAGARRHGRRRRQDRRHLRILLDLSRLRPRRLRPITVRRLAADGRPPVTGVRETPPGARRRG